MIWVVCFNGVWPEDLTVETMYFRQMETSDGTETSDYTEKNMSYKIKSSEYTD